MIKIAMTGTRGHFARVLDEIAAISDAQIVGIADGGDSADAIARWCQSHGQNPQRFSDHREMLDRTRPDLAVVCGPFELHAEQTSDAIDRNIHVLTEKPAALTFDDLNRLRESVQHHPTIHLAGMMFSRYDPGFFTAHQLVAGGAVGEIRHIDARKSYKLGTRPAYYHDRSTYGGTIPWVGSHAIDWVMWLANRAFTRVFASHSAAHNAGNGTMERCASCHFTLAGDITASVSIDVFRPATAPTHGDDWLRIVGTTGVLEARPDSVQLINAESDGSRPVPVSCDRRPLSDIIGHITNKRPALIDARSTLSLTKACLLARQSADEQRVIKFES